MENFLCIPIHLDALYLPSPRTIVEAHADFSRLPYVAKNKAGNLADFNADTPYLGEAIVSKPLKDEGLYLQAGVHLHWALPYALMRALQNKAGLQWPIVPNRWLVTRTKENVVAQWIVESDYLYPDGVVEPNSITFPVETTPQKPHPFRYMGRRYTLGEWLKSPSAKPQPEYLDKLTAMGYGDPNFAALYPNCHSVFGFHDPEFSKAEDIRGLQYDVIGWYANPADDFMNPVDSFWLQHAYKTIYARFHLLMPFGEDEKSTALQLATELKEEKKREALQIEFNWQIDKPVNGDFPKRSIYYASLNWLSEIFPADNQAHIQVVVGNTGTEALSAYLASKLFPDNKDEKNKAEDQIEALLLESEGKKHRLDWGFKFREARHAKGFTSFEGGTIWSIRANVPRSDQNTQVAGQNQEQVIFPPKLGHLLNRLNQQQKLLDRATDEAEDLRRLLYADWCKYQRCAYPPEESRTSYPPAEEVRYFIKHNDITRLLHKMALVNLYTEQRDKAKTEVDNTLLFFNGEIKSKNKGAVAPQPTYTLQETPGQRYWRANDPVLLIAGPGIRPSSRHGESKELTCKVLQAELPAYTESFINSLSEVFRGETPSFWSKQPWNPYLLEWEVVLLPVRPGSNLASETHNYAADYIHANFELPVDGVDLEPKGGEVVNAANFYSGRSILTPHAGQNITTTLKTWLIKQNIDTAKLWLESGAKPTHSKDADQAYNDAYARIKTWLDNYNPKSADSKTTDLNVWLDDQSKAWMESQGENPYSALKSQLNHFTDPAYQNILDIYGKLQAAEESYLSQSLSGFHEALLMQRPTFQMPLKDPLTFDDQQEFVAEVEKLIGKSKRIAPHLSNDFNPIRTGVMRLINLRLVDTFGRTRTLVKGGNVKQVFAAETLTPTKDLPDDQVYLPPRLAQPARLDFYWLMADGRTDDGDEVEMNRRPAVSPVCGWLLPNNLDNTLLVYNQSGGILGWIEKVGGKVVWQVAPEASGPVYTDTISNPHLRNVVRHILETSQATQEADGTSYFEHFLTTLNSALENIDPENFAHHEALALLMGRPIAVARASLSLELKGLPAIDHALNRFRQDLQSASATSQRTTDHFTAVQFPIRLGDYRQLNDGLVGYWVETHEGGFENDIFYSPQSGKNPSANIRTHANGKMNRHLTLADVPETYTLLLDPRGVVHAHCGILPARTLAIPPDQYQAALKALEVFFLTAPILTPTGKLTLPLPVEPGYKWLWLGRQNGAEWQSITSIEKPNLQANFPVQQDILEGWLKLRADPDEQP